MENAKSRSVTGVTGADLVFRSLDQIVERIHQHVSEPLFSRDLARRRDTAPTFALPDEHILKRMIILIAFSQQVQSRSIVKMIEDGVFERVFASFLPAEVAKLDPSGLRREYWNNLAALRFPRKLVSMVDCATVLLTIAAQHGSFMRFLEAQRFPVRIRSQEDLRQFWQAFDVTRSYFKRINLPFFKDFTTLCHLLQDLGFDCAKPDSIVMSTAHRVGIVVATQHTQNDRRKVVQTMQRYSAYRGIPTPVVDLYFLICGGQTDARKFVTPAYYTLTQ
ncbi:MAG TPA: hypothetical protein VMV69_02340 [Pirellulales bacterium]|nr:hypothetical protein [Pirellulales bacterium]